MRVEVDQSGRIEETNKPTVVAFSNNIQFSIYVSAFEKRKILGELRGRKPKWSRTTINVFVFLVLLVILLEKYVKKELLVYIDKEYPGYEAIIKNRLLTFLNRKSQRVTVGQINFVSVGKKSPAHSLAITVYRSRKKSDKILTSGEILRYFK
ncbi:hypothetical protein A2892_04720 [Candidatus Woesebacteria bacterium RIFCSPLOWO2_01_FULL_39_10b]|uniref:Uncharacterized protein n=1 Tax=Candidatus Woesebacteria bacterium RIFCSPLOWO2_01_FULL_39_10b TaxID=1802517 RepID=A0A1F8B998_9BACT|nr:MAG: hypothetical protein A2892_04720 [Candidatus Woesebacteria bacterium RIFCSPLOWO2_01_FULL_39_10b]